MSALKKMMSMVPEDELEYVKRMSLREGDTLKEEEIALLLKRLDT